MCTQIVANVTNKVRGGFCNIFIDCEHNGEKWLTSFFPYIYHRFSPFFLFAFSLFTLNFNILNTFFFSSKVHPQESNQHPQANSHFQIIK